MLNQIWWRRIARIYNHASAVVGPSQTAIRYLAEAGLRVPGESISNGVDLGLYKPATQSAATQRSRLGLPDKPTVVYVGRMAAEKQLDEVIDAVAKAKRSVDLQLVMVGEGWARSDLEKRARKRSIAKRVIFTGFVETNEQKVAYMQAADVLVMPSTVELQSLVTLEALACGLPVIAVNEGALPELVAAGQNGELFPARDSKKLAHLLTELLTNKQQLSRYSRKSLEVAVDHGIAEMPRKYTDLYNRLMAKSR